MAGTTYENHGSEHADEPQPSWVPVEVRTQAQTATTAASPAAQDSGPIFDTHPECPNSKVQLPPVGKPSSAVSTGNTPVESLHVFDPRAIHDGR